jgi:two-component system phosphate regulon response regulator PhoB
MSKGSILVVDDEPHITHVLALKFKNAGYDVRTASDGEEAYELACAAPPDIIITDLQMPYMSGLALCLKLKATRVTAQVPAIMLTARGHALEENDLLKTNIRLVLSKPFGPRQVLETVQEILRGEAERKAREGERGAAAA